ncbi:MAG: hypothetical protein EA419_09795 [Wenzhouxiangella sp.]|nr:MAG: hypothetical protein EA419_09795 [Wenzhouxiangella sp.]
MKIPLSSMRAVPVLFLATIAFSADAATGPDENLTRCAELELRVAGLFRVGTATLYLDRCADADRILESVPKQFSLELARSFKGKDLIESARSTLMQNLALASSDDLPSALRCMADGYVDAESGDRYDVVYRPGDGLRLFLNNDLLRQCDDGDDAEKYFMIWFGDKPFHRRMRDRLLDEALSNGAIG